MNATTQKCAHAGCKCSVVEGRRYCSSHCEQHATAQRKDGDVMCGCGHPECGSTEAAAGCRRYT